MRNTEENKTIVRLKTSCFVTARGIHIKKDILFLRRLCKGFNIIADDALQCEVEDTVCRVVNLDRCSDGIYEISIINESKDFESGNIEEWEYELRPYYID